MGRKTFKKGSKRSTRKKRVILSMYPLLHIALYGSKKKDCEFIQEINGRRLMTDFYEYFHGLDQYVIDDWSAGPLPFNDFSIWLRPKSADHPIKKDMAAVKKFIKGYKCVKTYTIQLHTSEVDTTKL